MSPAKQRLLVIGLIVVGLSLVGFFGLRFFHAFRQFRGHRPPPLPPSAAEQAETDIELIREWMTIPFIAKTYHVPPPLLFDALNIPPTKRDGEKNLQELNDEYFPDAPGKVLELIKDAIRAGQPRTAPAPPDPASP